jgi:O-antigen ligase
MATAVALGLALEALARLRTAWARRRRGFLALGDREGNAAVRACAVVMVLVAGLAASTSRGGISAFAAAALLLPFASRRRGPTALAVAGLVATGVAWIGLGGYFSAFTRGFRASRVDLWADMARMWPAFPVFGDGWNAFPTAYAGYQTVWRTDWIGEAHNEYLQVLLDAGVLGAALVLALLAVLARAALERARMSAVDLGVFGALAALAFHNLVDFNWQIPANAATWVALAALACRPLEFEPADLHPPGHRRLSAFGDPLEAAAGSP